MKTLPNRVTSIREKLSSADPSRCRFLWGATAGVAIGELLRGSSLGGRANELSGRSVLLATGDQLAAALALIELDGIADRIVICPPEISLDQFPSLIQKGGVDRDFFVMLSVKGAASL
jgi:hypothetical protein